MQRMEARRSQLPFCHCVETENEASKEERRPGEEERWVSEDSLKRPFPKFCPRTFKLYEATHSFWVAGSERILQIPSLTTSAVERRRGALAGWARRVG